MSATDPQTGEAPAPHPTAPAAAAAAVTAPDVTAPNPDEFRSAMSRLASGVSLISAYDPEEGVSGEDVGMTATAFLSVSLNPPMVLISVRAGARMDELLERQPLWAVSVLSESQRHVAGRFAMRGRISDRLLFEDVPYYRGAASGAPLVGGALAVVECRTAQRIPAGDHTLVIGHVLTAATPSRAGRPLTYFRGRYQQLA